jgi:hypothetical protein
MLPLAPPAGSSSLFDTPTSFQIGKGALIGTAEIFYCDAVFSVYAGDRTEVEVAIVGGLIYLSMYIHLPI